MKFMNSILFVSLAIGVSACTLKVSDRSADKDATGQFLGEYAGRTEATAESNSRTEIRHSGSINFYSRVNSRCRIVVSGRIDKVLKYHDGNFYGVTYRYDSVQTSISSCFENVTSCKLDLDDCSRSVDDYTKRTRDGSKTVLVSVGQDPKTVNLLP